MSRDPIGTPLLAGVFALGSLLVQAAAQAPFELVPGRLEPLVDRALFERLDGVEHRLHEPRPAGIALRFDRPWEGGLSGYCTVLRDGDRWLLYYRGRPVVGRARDATAEAREVTCVAVSDDGLSWTRPSVDAAGRNVILEEPPEVCHNFAPFVDTRAGVAPSHCFKALGGTQASGLLAWHSADGLHWQQTRDEPVITAGAFDSQNIAFWSPHENCYVCYLRVFVDRVRWIARSTSVDFLSWTVPEPIIADGPREHLYTNQTVPYVRAPHLYLATPARFWPGRRALSPAQQQEIGLDQPDRYPGLAGGTSDAVLMSSRDGRHFDRPFLSSWIRPGRDLRNWVARANYPAHGIHETAPGELSVWIQRAYGQPSAHLERMTLRTDGFASLHADAPGGTVWTVPVRLGPPHPAVATDGSAVAGKSAELRLALNVATSAAGEVRVGLEDLDGNPKPGRGLDDCDPIHGDDLQRIVTWRGDAELAEFAGPVLRLRIVVRDADVFALRLE